MYLLSDIHFWSTFEDIIIKHVDFSAFKYFTRKEANDQLFYKGKKTYCEERGIIWHPNNKRPFKVKDRLKELEECLLQTKVICTSCAGNNFQLLLANGLLVNITVDPTTCDITNISFNKSLAAKVQTELICDGRIDREQIACISTDGRVFCHGGMWREGWVIESGAKKKIDLHNELLCVWGGVNAEKPQPWSPLVKDHQRANLLLYWVGSRGPELFAYKKTEGEPICVIISKVLSKSLISVEQKVSLRGMDKMNFNAIDKLSASHVTNLLSKYDDAQATRQFLIFTRSVIDCFLVKTLSMERRIYLIWFSTFFLRIWRAWIKNNQSYTLGKNWITLNTYTCVELNAHALLLFIEKMRADETINFLPWLCSSQPCEKIFRQTRAMTSTYVTMVNFDMLDFTQRLKRIQAINDIISDSNGAVSIEVNVLEVTANVLKRTSVISVPLQTQISCCSLSNNEGRLLLGCIDGSVALLDRISGATQIIKSSIIPTHAIWHAYDAIAAISNEKGQLQYFDTALNRINTQFNADEGISIPLLDLSSYFNLQPNISTMKWGRCGIMIIFEHGPLTIVTHLDKSLTFASLVEQYMKTGKIKKAISLLLSWDWDEQFFAVLQFIILSLLKSPLTEESSESLQKALSCFYSPIVRLDSEIKDKYEGRILALTRRFFHQLVRYKMFETAFLLAVDIGHHDLFMDLYYCAIKMNEKEMAAAARAHASAILSRCSSEGSCCSQSSCSQCSETYTDESNESEKLQTAHEHISAYTSNSDNYLTTNFNECAPNTYNESPTKDFPQPPRLLQNFPEIQAPPLPIPPTFTAQYSLPSRPIPPRPFIPKPQVSRERVWTYNPPLPPIQTTAPPAPSSSQPSQQASVKKQQAKVKFSDTVTAFIVPEIKRPPRPPPPPHITNPQRELADSLPLCHPNEDYLKDFTPVRHESDDTITKPKIKVVHFGIV